jgi:hypothetical protein
MKSTKLVFLISILTASLTLLLAYATDLHWMGAVSAAGLGLMGWLGQYKQKWSWTIHLFLAGVVILIMFAVLIGLKLYLLLPALLGTLAAWDVGRFQRRMEEVPGSEFVQKIEKRHLALLTLTLVSGGIFASIVLAIRVQVGFGITLVLGVTLVISLGQIYRMLTNQDGIT